MKKTVLYFLSSDHNYGAPKSLMELITYLKEYEDIEPIVITCTHGKVNDYCNDMGIENYCVKYREFMIVGGSNLFRKIVKRLLMPFYLLRYRITNNFAKKKIDKIINFKRVDIIHTNINRVNIGSYFSKKYKIPHVWHIREFGQEDYNCISLEYNYIKKMNNSNSQFIAISNIVKESWENKGLNSDKIVTIYNGIDNKKILSKNVYKKDSIYKVIFAGLISETKGQIQLIDAISKLSESDRKKIKIDIYGGGREKYISFLKNKIKNYNLDSVIEFKGYSSDLYSLYRKYDIGVVCSKSEGFGRVTAEYMMSGLCVIASDKGANVELIDNGKGGFLYKYGDINSLRDIFYDIVHDRVDIVSMQKYSYEKANKLYTMKKCASNVKRIYMKLEEEQ